MTRKIKARILIAYFLALLTLISSSTSLAKNYAYYYGGAEPNWDDNFFKYSLRDFAHSMQEKKDWEVNYQFGPEDRVVQNDTFLTAGKKTPPFTSKNFTDSIREIMHKIESGIIKEKDQVLVALDTHGSDPADGVHMITAGDGDLIPHSWLLKDLADMAEKKGIKLGIVSATCYSGMLIPNANKNTCIISASREDSVGYAWTSSQLFQALKDSKNLEEAYLQARKNSDWNMTQPMISTPAGLTLQSWFNKLGDFLPPEPSLWIRQNKFVCRGTSSLFSAQESIQNLHQLEQAFKSNGIQSSGAVDSMTLWSSTLAANLKEYEKKIRNFQDDSVSLFRKTKFKGKEFEIAYNLASEAGKGVPVSRMANHSKLVRDFDALKKSPEFQKRLKIEKDLETKYSQLNNDLDYITVLERSLFETYYREISKGQGKNACSNFKL